MPGKPSIWLRRRSIRVRVTLAASTVLGVALVIGALALIGLQHRSLVHEIDVGLNDRIDGLIADAALGQLGPYVPLTGRETGVVQIIDANGAVLASTPGLGDVPVLDRVKPHIGSPAFDSVGDLSVAGDKRERWRIAAQQIDTTIGPVRIYAATTLDGVDHSIRQLSLLFLGGIPLMVAGLVLVVWRSTGWALAPVDSLTRQVDEIQATELDQMLTEPGTGDEIAHLTDTMNGLLRRLHASRQRSRRFAADASHELRSPLTAARLGLEVALAHPDKTDWTTTANDTLAELARLESLARDLLELTRLDPSRAIAAAVPVDLTELIVAEVELRSRSNPDLEVSCDTVPATVNGVPDLILRAVRNVLDNAERHAARRITVIVRCTSSGSAVSILNDGPPVRPQDRDLAFEPFVRLDESRASADGGTGLGLAIVADIMAAHRGIAEFVDPPTGFGTALRLTFPPL